MDRAGEYKIGVDIGGTFTDLVMVESGSGRIFNEKVLTTPDDPSRGVLAGIGLVLDRNEVRPAQVAHIIHGTTLVANALIERKGVRTALLTTDGFRDVLQIGREWRYDTYDLMIDVVEPLVPRALRFEVKERVGADGCVLEPLDEAGLRDIGRAIAAASVEALGICFLHSFKHTAHEQRAKAILGELLPGVTICISSEVMPEIGEYERTATTTANAYVQPIFRNYVSRLSAGLKKLGIPRDLYLMQSDGGTVHQNTAMEYPIRLVQSGPAGGAQVASVIGRLAGEGDILCFDMGGTTAKACLIENGEPTRSNDFEVARVYRFKKGSGIPLKVPVVDMIEIGSGGGSIARINNMDLIQVGPDSSSALPGPACYGQGGLDPTVTDADLMLGYLDPESFLGGDMKLDRAAAEKVIQGQIGAPLGLSLVEAAWGIHETVNENMSQAAGIHALEKGKRAEDFVMIPIGGAGPVHACHVAMKLGIRKLICPLGAGVASAFGFLSAPTAFEFVQASVSPLSRLDVGAANALIADLERRGRGLLRESGIDDADLQVRVSAAMRYIGQGHEIAVAQRDPKFDGELPARLRTDFEHAYLNLYGRIESDMAAEVVSWRVVVSGPTPDLAPAVSSIAGDLNAARKRPRPIFDASRMDFVEAAVYDRYRIPAAAAIVGPAVIEERESTLIVPAGANALVDRYSNVIVNLPAAE